MDRWCDAELAISRAVDEVEKMPADLRLTDAVILLSEARGKVADFVDQIPRDAPGAFRSAPHGAVTPGEVQSELQRVVIDTAAGQRTRSGTGRSGKLEKSGQRMAY
jgi:hypothetical protein